MALRRSQGFKTLGMIKRDSGVMEGEQNETENEVVDRSLGRNSTRCSDANKTLLDSCIRQTVDEDISMPSVASFISFSFLFYLRQWNNLPLRHFSVSLYLFISFPSYLPSLYCDISTFPIFISLSFHSASRLVSIPFSSFFAESYLPPASIIIFHLLTLSLSLTQSCSL